MGVIFILHCAPFGHEGLYENAPSLYRRDAGMRRQYSLPLYRLNVGMRHHYSLPLDGGGRGGDDFHASLCPFQGMTVSESVSLCPIQHSQCRKHRINAYRLYDLTEILRPSEFDVCDADCPHPADRPPDLLYELIAYQAPFFKRKRPLDRPVTFFACP